MKINKLFTALALGTLIFASCEKNEIEEMLPEEVMPEEVSKGAFENGILISGEGSGAGTGSVTFISEDFTVTDNLIYKDVNKTELGTFLQSMSFDNDRVFITVDNQNTITVANRFTFEKIGEISTGLEVPRYMTVVGNTGYVTNWGKGSFGDNIADDFIAVVDLNTLTVTSTINVAVGPERIIHRNGKLYVSHKGAFGTNNKVSVINVADGNVDKVITVKDNPDELFFNSDDELVVLSEGRTIFDANFTVIGNTLAGIATINPVTLEVASELIFAEGVHPSLMAIENDDIYYNIGNDVFSVKDDAVALATDKSITAEGFLYGLEVEGNFIYTLNASFSDLSKLNVYDATSSAKVQTVDAPIGASKIYFN